MNSIKVKRKEVLGIIQATFSDYSGRKIKVVGSQLVIDIG
jgi:hypothetical protein